MAWEWEDSSEEKYSFASTSYREREWKSPCNLKTKTCRTTEIYNNFIKYTFQVTSKFWSRQPLLFLRYTISSFSTQDYWLTYKKQGFPLSLGSIKKCGALCMNSSKLDYKWSTDCSTYPLQPFSRLGRQQDGELEYWYFCSSFATSTSTWSVAKCFYVSLRPSLERAGTGHVHTCIPSQTSL